MSTVYPPMLSPQHVDPSLTPTKIMLMGLLRGFGGIATRGCVHLVKDPSRVIEGVSRGCDPGYRCRGSAS